MKKKIYCVESSETVYNTTYIKAESPEKAEELLQNAEVVIGDITSGDYFEIFQTHEIKIEDVPAGVRIQKEK